ncbi:rhodanese-like domain-containing protein [Streptomyces sp. NK08204]|uniref:rhodanese-like domain-containing protein n=1 Tax=Streptomyces sp. NK08204 TaxID=2873260 RepID=UPI001CEC6015|nr:rhodanese-like domain-containing protein [Streptomyces sp. NK08204]
MFLHRRGEDRVTAGEARRRTQGADAPAVLLDVREQGEWNAGHAPGAVHAPLSRLAAGAALPSAAQGRPLVVICRSGNRSQQAAELLTERGAEAVDVKGGMQAWAAAGHPVVDERGNNGSIA